MAGFLTSASASLTTGTRLITISGNVDCSFVVSGTAVYLNNILMEGVSGTAPDPSGNSSITIRSLYTGSSIVGGTLVAFNTIEGLRDAIQRARELAVTQVTNNSQLDTFLTNATTSVDLELPNGTVTVSPYKYISGLVLGNDVKQYAMSQAQFEAVRAQNKDKYAASGWVSFGNHESGNQVNECKPGLYTSLTTPNTLLIGKSGGVGGSKTDNAVVHIDGVVFNLTNQFVLTLPSHPTSVLPERMDMYGVESEKVEISSVSPNAYQGGLRGVGTAVNLFTATNQQKKDFFAQNSNTTYIGSDGKIYQWQLYKVSFAGTTDGVPSPTEQGYTLNSFGDLWLKDGKNLLYFGNALRLNDGGYHPSFNPLGSAKFVGDTFWYNTAGSITSKADCFNPSKLLAGSGSISSGKSGRNFDGRYYDGIYADGEGGVCSDMRYSADEVTLNCLAEYEKIVGNETSRGAEHLVFTKIFPETYPNTIQSDSHYLYSPEFFKGNALAITALRVGDTFHKEFEGQLYSSVITEISEQASGDQLFIRTADPLPRSEGTLSAWSIHTQYLVGGEFLRIDLVGAMSLINSSNKFYEGWIGGYIAVIFNDTPKTYEYTRKAISIYGNTVYTINNSAWSVSANAVNPSINNSETNSNPLGLLAAVSYKASSYRTEESAHLNVFNGKTAINSIFSSSDYRAENGALLGESLIGRVLKNNSGVSVNNKSLLSCSIDSTGKLTSEANFDGVTHHTLTLSSPSNSSPAFKAISYPVIINNKVFIQYVATELKYSGSSWGDNGKQNITDGEATKVDDNGQTVKVVTHISVEQVGWVKNNL